MYFRFSQKWYERATEQRQLDIPDRFLNLWISFNGWMKYEYGEKLSDANLIFRASKDHSLEKIFDEINNNEEIRGWFEALSGCMVLDSRNPSLESKVKQYSGCLKSYIEIIYSIRCNLFHGRKNVAEDKTDEQLVMIAYHVLEPFVQRILKQ